MTTVVGKAAEGIKLDLYDASMTVIESLEALQLLAPDHPALLRRLQEMHGTMVRLSAQIHKLDLTPAQAEPVPVDEEAEL